MEVWKARLEFWGKTIFALKLVVEKSDIKIGITREKPAHYDLTKEFMKNTWLRTIQKRRFKSKVKKQIVYYLFKTNVNWINDWYQILLLSSIQVFMESTPPNFIDQTY